MDAKELTALLGSLDVKDISVEDFKGAAEKAKSLKSLDQDHQLLLYGLYKQGTVGDVNIAQPYSFNITDSLKWKAWKRFEGFSKVNAMIGYSHSVNQLSVGKSVKESSSSKLSATAPNSTKSTASVSIKSDVKSDKTMNTATSSVKITEAAAAAAEVCPFDGTVHLRTSDPTPQQLESIQQLRGLLQSSPHYKNHSDWADDTQLLRFLIARNFVVKDSFELFKVALKWRELRQPSQIESSAGWPANMSRESETGKIYCPGNDKWGRSVLIFDNTVQNTNSIDDQMTFLAWNLEFAIKLMPPKVDKYLVFMHLNSFSFFNTPPMASTKETIHMLCNCYPERLGHCIAYQPPSVFRVFFNTVKGFLDPKTANKMVFIIGDVSEGSDNDKKMRELIGDNWKVLTGAEQPVRQKNSSPGYSHEEYWPTVLRRLSDLVKGSNTGSSSGSESGAVTDREDGEEQQQGEGEEENRERRISNKERYSRMKSFSEAVMLKKSKGNSASSSGSGVSEKNGLKAIAQVDEVNHLLTDLLYFLSIIGLGVLLFEWNKQTAAAAASGGAGRWS